MTCYGSGTGTLVILCGASLAADSAAQLRQRCEERMSLFLTSHKGRAKCSDLTEVGFFVCVMYAWWFSLVVAYVRSIYLVNLVMLLHAVSRLW